MEKWELLSSKLALDNQWFKVRQDIVKLPNGKIIDDYFVWQTGLVVMIVAITKNQEFVLVKQYKHGVQEVVLEHTAGIVEEGEDIEEAARRELQEETGYRAEKLLKLTVLNDSPAKSTGKTHIFLAQDVKKEAEQQLDETENIEVMTVSSEKIREMIKSGEIKTATSIAATFLALQELGLISTEK